MSADPDPDALSKLRGRVVVLDLASSFIVVGTLVDEDHRYLILDEADVHDLRDSSTTREVYVVDCKRHGRQPNRRRVLVNRSEIVSISALDDVIA